MGTEFLRLRRKNTLWRFGRSVLTGMAVAMLIAGGLMIFFKLTTTSGQMALSACIGAGAGLVAMVVRWLMLRSNDLRAAELIDSEHHLKERVQTMIAFRDEDSAMLQLQREDTEQRLKSVSKYGVRVVSVLGHYLLVLVATAVLFFGLVMPARAEVEPPVYVEPDYNATAWQIAALEELIVHVQESNMAQPAKDETVAELQSLRSSLDASITVSAFKAKVITAIRNTYTYTDMVNSNDDMHDVFAAMEHELADDLAYLVGYIANPQFNTDAEDIGVQLGKQKKDTFGALAAEMEPQLARIVSEYIPLNNYDETDVMYQAALEFNEGLYELAALVEAEAGDEAISSRLGEVIYTFKSQINLAVIQQCVTKDECVYVVQTLCSIFGILPNECPADPDPVYSKKGPDEDFKEQEGAPGDGEMQYAGDEQVYDYKQNQYVSYTELVAEYYAAMVQAKQEGVISAEMAEFILRYFSQLYTG